MVNIAVTGLNAGDSPAPGVPVVRSLRERAGFKGRIIGLGYDALESGILDAGVVDAAYLLPFPSVGKDALLERILNIHEKEKLDVIIPNLDSELMNFIQIQPALEREGIKFLLPTEEQLGRRAKSNLPKLCKELNVKTPATKVVNDPSTLSLGKDELPVMVKGLFYESYLAHSHAEAVHFMHKIAGKWGYPVLIQQYIEGEEFNAAALGDGKGGMDGVACMKKLVLTDNGKGWACVSIKNDGLITLAETIIRSLKWAGAMEVEAMQSKKDGEFYLIEINPRFPAWIY
ncbi:MAG: ATP-grasp domain-containing protein, partial [Nitrospinae bacterium]|nr:ATP-grasp domain-containing protein [Nitrospinota bacterium]